MCLEDIPSEDYISCTWVLQTLQNLKKEKNAFRVIPRIFMI